MEEIWENARSGWVTGSTDFLQGYSDHGYLIHVELGPIIARYVRLLGNVRLHAIVEEKIRTGSPGYSGL